MPENSAPIPDDIALTAAVFRRDDIRAQITKAEAALNETATTLRNLKLQLSEINDTIDHLTGQDSLL